MVGRTTLTVMLSVLALAPGIGVAQEATPAPLAGPGPASSPSDPFYEVPAALPPGPPGDLIRAEAIAVPGGVRAWRILYRSTGLDGKPVVVSGSIFAPDAPAPPAGFPLVAVGHNTTGVAPACGPSRDPFTPLPGAEEAFYEQQVAGFVEGGFAAVATDYRGLGAADGPHPYFVGEAAAYDVLDAARAARRLEGLALAADTFLWGHSQGGHAAAWAAQLAPTYAPELAITGVILGAPVGDPALILAAATDDPTAATPLTGYVASLVHAWDAIFPGIASAPALTPAGRAKALLIASDCIPAVAAAYADRPLADYLDPAAFSVEPWPTVLDANAAGRTLIAAAMLVVQGTADPLVPSAATKAFVGRLCANGAEAALLLYPGVEHGAVIAAAMPDILAWAKALIAGGTSPTSC